MSDDRVEETLTDLIDWVEVWDRVCDAAWGDDNKDPPPWTEVAAAELPDWGGTAHSADYWSAYMEARLTHLVADYLHAIGRHPTWSKSKGNPATKQTETQA